MLAHLKTPCTLYSVQRFHFHIFTWLVSLALHGACEDHEEHILVASPGCLSGHNSSDTKGVKRSDPLWHFACFDVSLCLHKLHCALVWLTLCARGPKRSLEKLNLYLFLISPSASKICTALWSTKQKAGKGLCSEKRKCNLAVDSFPARLLIAISFSYLTTDHHHRGSSIHQIFKV